MDLGDRRNTFRVVAPCAPQGTALEKYRCPDSRTVFSGHPLDFQDCSLMAPRLVVVVHVIRQLESVVAQPGYDFVLQFFTYGCEVCIISGYPHQEVTVIARVLLSVSQHVRVEHVNL